MERVTVYLQARPINFARQTFVGRCSVIISIIESTARERIVVGEEMKSLPHSVHGPLIPRFAVSGEEVPPLCGRKFEIRFPHINSHPNFSTPTD